MIETVEMYETRIILNSAGEPIEIEVPVLVWIYKED